MRCIVKPSDFFIKKPYIIEVKKRFTRNWSKNRSLTLKKKYLWKGPEPKQCTFPSLGNWVEQFINEKGLLKKNMNAITFFVLESNPVKNETLSKTSHNFFKRVSKIFYS